MTMPKPVGAAAAALGPWSEGTVQLVAFIARALGDVIVRLGEGATVYVGSAWVEIDLGISRRGQSGPIMLRRADD